MNTLNRDQIDQLERLLKRPVKAEPKVNRTRTQSLVWLKLGLLSMLALAITACLRPDGLTLFCCMLVIIALLTYYPTLKVDLHPQLVQPSRVPLLAFGLGLLGMLGVIVAFIQPILNSTHVSTTYADPVVATSSDPNLGTTVVGGKLPGMSLKKSQLTGHVDTNSLTSALYWTMDFANSSNEPQEARARIALPEGAAVSRVTLWSNGVEQEAAFNSSTRTQAAYQWITNTGRDPLLITETKKGEVFLQAFPVPVNGEMKVRFGITSPLISMTRRDFSLVPPRIVESNFAGDKPESKIKLESNSPIATTGGGLAINDDGGNFVLAGTRRDDAPVLVHRQNDFTTFASRATHSSEPSYITEELKDTSQGLKAVFEKTQSLPQGLVAYDFPTASRMSTLWAAAEARKCAALNEWETAAQLGTAYRVVTPASGAVVLENNDDYSYTGLKRSFYNVVPATAKAGNPHARKAKSVDAALESNARRNEKGVIDPHTMAWLPGQPPLVITGNAVAPVLQGATNGTIGPQGVDATYITGVNTAGTVRVNNLANFEACLNILVNAFEVGALICGAILLVDGLFAPIASRAVSRILMSSSCMIAGLLLPQFVNFLVASMRDANIFYYNLRSF